MTISSQVPLNTYLDTLIAGFHWNYSIISTFRNFTDLATVVLRSPEVSLDKVCPRSPPLWNGRFATMWLV